MKSAQEAQIKISSLCCMSSNLKRQGIRSKAQQKIWANNKCFSKLMSQEHITKIKELLKSNKRTQLNTQLQILGQEPQNNHTSNQFLLKVIHYPHWIAH